MLAKKENYAAATTMRKPWRIFSSVCNSTSCIENYFDRSCDKNSARYNFPQDQVLLLTDVDAKYRPPTRKELFSAFSWLVEGAQPNDSLFLHCMFQLQTRSFSHDWKREIVDSGHGGQSPDASGREADGMDDSMCCFFNFSDVCRLSFLAIFPVDFKKEGDIIDDVSPHVRR